MTDKKGWNGTEDKAQLQALGQYMDKVARGEITPAKPEDLGKHTVPRWGFTPEERARLEELRDKQAKAPKTPKP